MLQLHIQIVAAAARATAAQRRPLLRLYECYPQTAIIVWRCNTFRKATEHPYASFS